MDMGKRFEEKENSLYNSAADVDKRPSSFYGREQKCLASASMDRERLEVKNSYSDSTGQKLNTYSQNSVDTDEKVQKVSPPRRKGSKEERSQRHANWQKRDANGSDLSTTSSKQQSTGNYKITTTSNIQYDAEPSPEGRNISALLEVCQICFTALSLSVFS